MTFDNWGYDDPANVLPQADEPCGKEFSTMESNTAWLADALHQIENQIRMLEIERDVARGNLAEALITSGEDCVIGSSGQKYKLARPSAKYTFDLPVEVFQHLGILQECTPPAPGPKLTKMKLDELLKKRRLDDEVVAHWQRQGWYTIDRSGEISVKQVETKLGELKEAIGF
jgi:hypothetical protein